MPVHPHARSDSPEWTLDRTQGDSLHGSASIFTSLQLPAPDGIFPPPIPPDQSLEEFLGSLTLSERRGLLNSLHTHTDTSSLPKMEVCVDPRLSALRIHPREFRWAYGVLFQRVLCQEYEGVEDLLNRAKVEYRQIAHGSGGEEQGQQRRFQADLLPALILRRNQFTLGVMWGTDPKCALGVIRQIVNSFSQQRLDLFLSRLEPALLDPPCVQGTRNIFNSTRDRGVENALRIFELALACHAMDYMEFFQDMVEDARLSRRTLRDFTESMSRGLLVAFARRRSLPGGGSVSPEALCQWPVRYLSKLFWSMSVESSKSGFGDLFESTVLATLEGRFHDFLTDPESGYPMGKAVATHNRRVTDALSALGIDVDKWLNYSEVDRFELGLKGSGDTHLSSIASEIGQRVNVLLDALEEKYASALLNSLGKAGISIIDGTSPTIVTSGAGPSDRKASAGAVERLLVRENTEAVLTNLNYLWGRCSDDPETLGLVSALRSVLNQLPQLVEEYRDRGETPRHVVLRVWGRNPARDTFHGNYTVNCLAIENEEHRDAMIEMLVDLGIQVVELVDEDTDLPIAQDWCFIGMDGAVRPVMVSDQIEVAPHIMAIEEFRTKIREHMAAYVKGYATAVRAEAHYLGCSPFQDIDASVYPLVDNTVSKPGGFLWDLLGEGYAYYLEALFGQNTDQMPERSPRIHLLEDNLLHAGSSRQGPGIVEFLRPKIPDNVLREIAGIEQQSFPDSMRSDIREIEDLVSKGGINLLLRVSGGKAVGSVISMPFDTVFDTLGERDPSLKMPDCPALYVESFALIPEHRNAPAFLRLFRWLVLESRAAGYELLVMHARESNGVSRFIQSRGGENLRSVPDWHGFGERFDYVELKLNGNPLLR